MLMINEIFYDPMVCIDYDSIHSSFPDHDFHHSRLEETKPNF